MPKQIIVHVVQHLRPGGIETMALDLIGNDPNRFIISLEGEKNEAIASWSRIRSFGTRLKFLNKRPGIDISLIFKLAGTLREMGATAVHTHHVGPLLYGGLAARIARIQSIVHTEHDAWHLQDSKRQKLQSVLVKLVKPIFVADTNAVAAAVRRHLSGVSPSVITNGVDTLRFQPGAKCLSRAKLNLPKSARLIGCAARLETVKGHAYLLSALAQLPTDLHLALAGDGSLMAELKSQTQELGIQNRVHFLGVVEDMPSFYKAIDVFCLPSLNEGMPLSPLEAQACGTPVVATNVGGTRSAVCVRTGYLVPAKDSDELALAISKAFTTHEPQSPRDFVTAHADLRNTLTAYNKLYAA